MHAYGCVGSQYRGNEVSSARGDVCMHDLGVRVAGKFPDTSCSHEFWSKKNKNGQQAYSACTKAVINDLMNLANANANEYTPKTHTNAENIRPAQLCANT